MAQVKKPKVAVGIVLAIVIITVVSLYFLAQRTAVPPTPEVPVQDTTALDTLRQDTVFPND